MVMSDIWCQTSPSMDQGHRTKVQSTQNNIIPYAGAEKRISLHEGMVSNRKVYQIPSPEVQSPACNGFVWECLSYSAQTQHCTKDQNVPRTSIAVWNENGARWDSSLSLCMVDLFACSILTKEGISFIHINVGAPQWGPGGPWGP